MAGRMEDSRVLVTVWTVFMHVETRMTVKEAKQLQAAFYDFHQQRNAVGVWSYTDADTVERFTIPFVNITAMKISY